ncbi:MAG TPA: LytTR family DNA-binding domain-containing protein [Patescibacteria group bacterium]|nr:LytTR family DNA-binding domain-containing protein [Patescibacteria group bacterium]
MSLRAVVVDDEFPAREELKSLLQETGEVELVGEAEDGDEVAVLLDRYRPDVVFLDIEMRNQNGMVTAGEIMEREFPPAVVFTTGYSQYAVRAFALNAVDYILKPYSLERVNTCIAKLQKMKIDAVENGEIVADNVTSTPDSHFTHLSVWSKDRILILRPQDIFFARADENRQTLLQTVKGPITTKITLRELEVMLREQRFLRTHKSFLVNLTKVVEVIPWFNNTYMLVLEGVMENNIPVARHYMKEFNQLMNI